MGERLELRTQREPKVHKSRSPERRDSGYTEHQFRHLYQSEELERVADGHKKG